MERSNTVAGEMRQWVEDHWDPSGDLVSWRTQLAQSGWGTPSWPKQWFGRELPASTERISREVLYEAQAVGMASGVSMYLVAPTLLEWGTDTQLQQFLLPILTGQHKWCQLFSEPGAGSDLASLSTRAERDGDEWVISGQKVWNSGAQKADYGILLARTDFSGSKHQGISCFLIPMKQASIEVRPLHQMNGHSSFNEVFFNEARLPHDNLIASQGEGWRVALTTLAHERSAVATPRPKFPSSTTPLVLAAKSEADEYFATYSWYPQRAGRPRLVEPQARLFGKSQIPRVRQMVAEIESLQRTSSWTTQRASAARSAGRAPGPEGSVAKLNMSVTAQRSSAAHSTILGATGMLSGNSVSPHQLLAEVLISTPAQSIAGGTDEIQKNILAERVLGLPKEPSPPNKE
ncbi:MAG: acyl-CoA dehydrogenase [Acidimicrobiaceae bacterium]|nr:acyl-CoA dehydrogenase [Acidimicrobiaceae bacterium]|tara:strand:+ start:650 stop:1861 length:1212 start_codon:yes stop_codon:yes gene_type:complete